MPVAAQMNVRIDPDLKRRGDRVLAKRGLSPSQAVRAFYESVVGTKERSDEVLDAVLGCGPKHGAGADDSERARKLESIRKVQASVRMVAKSAGSTSAPEAAAAEPFGEAAADKAMLEKVISEHYAQKGMVG